MGLTIRDMGLTIATTGMLLVLGFGVYLLYYIKSFGMGVDLAFAWRIAHLIFASGIVAMGGMLLSSFGEGCLMDDTKLLSGNGAS